MNPSSLQKWGFNGGQSVTPLLPLSRKGKPPSPLDNRSGKWTFLGGGVVLAIIAPHHISLYIGQHTFKGTIMNTRALYFDVVI